jgi:hypothetical protein
MKFNTTIFLGGKTATGLRVPDEIVAGLGSGKRPAVRVTLNGYTYRSTIAPMGGEYLIPVSAEVRQNAGVAAGDEVEVDIELDTAPREVVVPPDFALALEQNPGARQAFAALSYSNQRRHLLSIEGAKTDDTRQRRIVKAISELSGGA